jgi:hypothetical protein
LHFVTSIWIQRITYKGKSAIFFSAMHLRVWPIIFHSFYLEPFLSKSIFWVYCWTQNILSRKYF